ncbi:peptide/nickel transport system ATP-binding protein/oligopeptide transport system ATP-binding protein [Antricoccus suffuscus]|uniref:Peptide/nickel transport system ATP-binding protein/oligopeptide transport system ATP-binding protein n=1 Tax=Antricoccus suffuscus TaxID=1629062 RepID=A0A2T0ZZD1_9ACTN|nr:ABC transporter ATP-binding protein [Antricoccus suffuscus]PRZ41597.1 peptide/nickel transport system ATP-binding protein/oligopeptide transport system ATP-binding protein [Antricoccus suffuscus]
MALLEVTDLSVTFPTADGLVRAVRGVSFALERGHTLGIVGESGSGKSVCTQTLLGLTQGATVTGTAMFEGHDLLTMGKKELRQVRGAQISTVFQDPLSSLHPLYKVGWQIVEMIRAHRKVSKRAARARAVELLSLVGIPEAESRVDDYPHQFSGGMRQRAMIAMALALDPALIIADEPTTALDATVQAQVIDLMTRLQKEFDTALIMITHDLGVIADIADEVLVMYAGRAVEQAPRRPLYYDAHHPYTVGLLESIPGAAGTGEKLRPIPGTPPSLINIPSGCAFHPRCRYAMQRCAVEDPQLTEVADDHTSACWLPPGLRGLAPQTHQARAAAANEAPLRESEREVAS